jgi:3-carboxy-cis,cis-muconate cycloisomerase
MPSTVFDSALFKDAFGSQAMRDIFSDEAFVRHCVAVEVALARVQERLGIIPSAAAEEIARGADPARIDFAKLKEETDLVGYPIVGLVHQLARQCGEAGRYIHWGATTQDIMDTATVLQIRDALTVVGRDLERLDSALVALIEKHRRTVMAGRTHLQHALPITFAHKAAVWLSMVRRNRSRLEELKPRVLVGEFAGAAGTLASLGDKGMAVHDGLMSELKLGTPSMTWHAGRDSLAETVGFLGIVAASLGKIAFDVALLMQTEVAEAFEPFVAGRGASSTMPQKRNPISCELILAAARIVRQHAGLMLDAVISDHERATGPWHLEWVAVPQSFIATGAALHHAGFMLDGLIVDVERMRSNIFMTGGLILAESVMMALAPHIGRGAAHDIVYAACRSAAEGKTELKGELVKADAVRAHLSDRQLSQLTEPANYLGSADAMIDRLLASHS